MKPCQNLIFRLYQPRRHYKRMMKQFSDNFGDMVWAIEVLTDKTDPSLKSTQHLTLAKTFKPITVVVYG